MKSMIAATVLGIGVLAFAGCSTTTPTAKTTPKAPSMELPAKVAGKISLDRLQGHEVQMLQRAGDVLLKVRLCVAPDGTVADAKLVEASGHNSYDMAVVSSIKSWQYQPYKAEKDMRVCKTVRVQYDAG